MSENLEYIKIVNERWWQSILSDLVTFSLGFGFMIPGLLLDSSAMQWLGAVIFIMCIMAKTSAVVKRFKTKTDAKNYIDTLNVKE